MQIHTAECTCSHAPRWERNMVPETVLDPVPRGMMPTLGRARATEYLSLKILDNLLRPRSYSTFTQTRHILSVRRWMHGYKKYV